MNSKFLRKTFILLLALCLTFTAFSFAFAGGDDEEEVVELTSAEKTSAYMNENFPGLYDSDQAEYDKIYNLVLSYYDSNYSSGLDEAKEEFANYNYRNEKTQYFETFIKDEFGITKSDGAIFNDLFERCMNRGLSDIQKKELLNNVVAAYVKDILDRFYDPSYKDAIEYVSENAAVTRNDVTTYHQAIAYDEMLKAYNNNRDNEDKAYDLIKNLHDTYFNSIPLPERKTSQQTGEIVETPEENPDTPVSPSTVDPIPAHNETGGKGEEGLEELTESEDVTFKEVEKNGETWYELTKDTSVSMLSYEANYDLKGHTLTINNTESNTFTKLAIKNGTIVYTGSCALFQANSGDITLTDLEIKANGSGQLIKFASDGALTGSITMTNVKATYSEQNNCGQRGALLYLAGTSADNFNVNLENSTFDNFASKYAGGAIYSEINNLTITAKKCTFNNCHSQVGGGFIYVYGNYNTFNLPATLIKNCFTADGNYDGGAIFILGNNCKIIGGEGTTFDGCHSGSTAGVENTNDGGAIYASVGENCGADVLIQDITFSNNYAGNWGGALCLRSGGTITGCSFSKNIAAKFFGDAIMGYGLKIENCKFYDKEGKYTDLGDSNLIDTCAREGSISANEINDCTIEKTDLPSAMTGTTLASGNVWILLGVLIAAIVGALAIVLSNKKKKANNIFNK